MRTEAQPRCWPAVTKSAMAARRGKQRLMATRIASAIARREVLPPCR
jgi:hypothetical protein